MYPNYNCIVCSKECKNLRSLSMHLDHNPFCDENHYNKASLNQSSRQIDAPDSDNYNIFDDNDSLRSNNIFEDEDDHFSLDSNFDYSLMDLKSIFYNPLF